MALLFTSGTSDKVDCGSGASLDDLAAGTFLAWVYPTALKADDTIVVKTAQSTGMRNFIAVGSGALRVDIDRATDLVIVSSASVLSTDSWQFVAAVFNTGGADADQKLFHGTLTSLAAETGYQVQQVGSGAVVSDAAHNLFIGNFNSGTFGAFAGRIAWVAHWNRVLTLAEIRAQQFRPHKTSGCVLFMHLGFNGTGTQPDHSGNFNSGTVTGATVAPHVPLALASPHIYSPYVVVSDFPLDAQPGSFTLTGVAANGAIATPATAGSYSLTGVQGTFAFGFPATAGSYAWSAQAAGLLAAYAENAAAGNYALTGAAATFDLGLPATAGNYALTGQAAAFDIAMNAAAGAFTWTGIAAELVHDAAPGQFLLDAQPGNFSLTGVAIGADVSSNAQPGNYALTGVNAGFALAISAAPGSVVWSGAAAGLLTDYVLVASPGAFTWTGVLADLVVPSIVFVVVSSIGVRATSVVETLAVRNTSTVTSITVRGTAVIDEVSFGSS